MSPRGAKRGAKGGEQGFNKQRARQSVTTICPQGHSYQALKEIEPVTFLTQESNNHGGHFLQCPPLRTQTARVKDQLLVVLRAKLGLSYLKLSPPVSTLTFQLLLLGKKLKRSKRVMRKSSALWPSHGFL